MTDILVSVVVPVYNLGDYLPACVESLLCQTVRSIEIILVDDGSSDNSGELCDVCAARDARVRSIHRPNGGVSAARNDGIDAARGEFIAFVDGDDRVAPDMYEYLLGLAQEYGADIAVCQYDEVELSGAVLRSMEKDCPPAFFGREGAVFEFFSGTSVSNSVCNKLFRREIVPRFAQDLRFGEDAVFVYRACAACRGMVVGGLSKYFYLQSRSGRASKAGDFANNTDDIRRVNLILGEVRRQFPQFEKYQSGLCAFMYARRFLYAARAGALDAATVSEVSEGLRLHRKNIGLCPAAHRNFRLLAWAAAKFPSASAALLRLIYLRKR